LCHIPVLKYYDVKKLVLISIDASKNGIEDVSLQDGKLVACAATVKIETETRYAQTEKELLAVVFACLKLL
jgi:hypothetical protein